MLLVSFDQSLFDCGVHVANCLIDHVIWIFIHTGHDSQEIAHVIVHGQSDCVPRSLALKNLHHLLHRFLGLITRIGAKGAK